MSTPRAASLAIVALLWQQTPASRILLATVSVGARPIVDVGVDDFVIEQGGVSGEVLDVYVADYPLALLIDNSAPTPGEQDAIRGAAAGFVARVGERAIAAGTLQGPSALLSTFEDDRAKVLAAVRAAPGAPSLIRPLDAIVRAVRAIQAIETPFSAVVVVSAGPVDSLAPSSADAITPIVDSRIPVHVIARRESGAPEAGADILQEVSRLTRGQYTPIYTTASYAIALDRLADRLAAEIMVQYLVPPGAPEAGEVRAGVRIPGARVTGLGVSR